ncbi:MAG TPA: PH domain-containing protein [Candidatus Dormibacteraeota bacterium]|nr:PH domain-containing protein [Candidatus Dormibacteraeota bacterium]
MTRLRTNFGGISNRKLKDQLNSGFMKDHYDRIKAELRENGAVIYDLMVPETHYLPFIIQPNEHIKGAVYGRSKAGRGVMVATDRRVLFVDKQPLHLYCDEIPPDTVSCVTRTHHGPVGTVTLCTPEGGRTIRTLNQKNAANFVNYVSSRYCPKTKKPKRR